MSLFRDTEHSLHRRIQFLESELAEKPSAELLAQRERELRLLIDRECQLLARIDRLQRQLVLSRGPGVLSCVVTPRPERSSQVVLLTTSLLLSGVAFMTVSIALLALLVHAN